MIKDKMSPIISNSKLSMASSKICLDVIEGFSKLTIDNKYTKSVFILQFLLKASTSNIGAFNYFFCWRDENPDGNNVSNKSKTEEKIKHGNKIN